MTATHRNDSTSRILKEQRQRCRCAVKRELGLLSTKWCRNTQTDEEAEKTESNETQAIRRACCSSLGLPLNSQSKDNFSPIHIQGTAPMTATRSTTQHLASAEPRFKEQRQERCKPDPNLHRSRLVRGRTQLALTTGTEDTPWDNHPATRPSPTRLRLRTFLPRTTRTTRSSISASSMPKRRAQTGPKWRRLVLQIDPTREPERARRAWETHLERAKWMTRHGFEHLLQGGPPH